MTHLKVSCHVTHLKVEERNAKHSVALHALWCIARKLHISIWSLCSQTWSLSR